MRKILLIVIAAGFPLAGACAAASAKTKAPADRPALNVPPPPPRVVEPVPVPEPGPEPVGDLPPAPTANRPPRPAPKEAPKEAAKADAKPSEPVAEPQPVLPPAVPPGATVPQLRTPQTADTMEAERTVRATLDRARAGLSTINYGPLSNERKKAYNDAKLFILQAEEALKQGNYVFAQGVATKAETLARELSGK